MNLFNQILKQNQVDLMECQWCEESWKSWRHSDTTGLSLLPLLKDTYLKSLISTITEKKEGRREERGKGEKQQTNQSKSEKDFQSEFNTQRYQGVYVCACTCMMHVCTYVYLWIKCKTAYIQLHLDTGLSGAL